jgi:hypothetical protein
MNIFLSYPSARRDLAERLKLALEEEQHEVFFDRDDLAPGEAYHQAIRQGVDAADLFIFVVAPESVRAGSYTLAELDLARQRWPVPDRHVLPLVVAPVPRDQLPPYLLAVTLLEPRGEPVAETLAAVARLQGGGGRRRLLQATAAVCAVAAVVVVGIWQHQRQLAAAETVRRVGEAMTLARLCAEGSPADPFDQLAALAAAPGAPAAVRQAHENCAMHWLRVARPGADRSFAQFTAPLRPVLLKGLAAGAEGQRAADLRAHLGWADAMVWQDQHDPGIDPSTLYRLALQDEPSNVYAHAMWGSWLLLRRPMQPEEAERHFAAAEAAGRDLGFVRRLQLGGLVGADEAGPSLVRLLDRMRRARETVSEGQRQRIWSYHYAHAWRDGAAVNVLQALPPQDALDTFDWLFPAPKADDSRRASWALLRAMLLTGAGRAAEARALLVPVQREHRATRASGPIVDAVDRFLARKP